MILSTGDFESFRSFLAKGRGPVALGKDVRVTRMAFKYALDSGLIDKPVRYGPNFKMPSRKKLRQARQTNGRRMFESVELRETIGKASQPLKAMILLGINAGMGNTDVASVPQSVIDFESGWMEYPRPKTAVERRIPLWPETIKVLKEAIGGRPQLKDESDAGLSIPYKIWAAMGEKQSY